MFFFFAAKMKHGNFFSRMVGKSEQSKDSPIDEKPTPLPADRVGPREIYIINDEKSNSNSTLDMVSLSSASNSGIGDSTIGDTKLPVNHRPLIQSLPKVSFPLPIRSNLLPVEEPGGREDSSPTDSQTSPESNPEANPKFNPKPNPDLNPETNPEPSPGTNAEANDSKSNPRLPELNKSPDPNPSSNPESGNPDNPEEVHDSRRNSLSEWCYAVFEFLLHEEGKDEKWWSTLMQVAVPFFIAGIGTIGAGLVLGHVQTWAVFLEVSSIFVLVPSLSGLKGNLDMCLASRLSTQANLGHMTSTREILTMVIGNISLVQVQAIVAAIMVALFAICVNAVVDQEVNLANALLLTSSAVFTATTTCFVLDFVLVSVIIVSHKFKMNPDNLATPLAASIGDVVSITVLSITASYMYRNIEESLWLPCVVIAIYLLILPMWVYIVYYNKYTRTVLTTGWTPVIVALFISGLGGLVLDQAVDRFEGFVVFQPIVNGIGGNLVSVLASRVSTMLHRTTVPGVLPEGSRIVEWPWKVLFHGTYTAKTARLLIFLAVVGQVVFMFAADYMFMSRVTITFAFALAYLICSTLQVMVLLYVAHVIVNKMWKSKMDPDNASIPYLTSLGDLLGSVFLGLTFFILLGLGKEYGGGGED